MSSVGTSWVPARNTSTGALGYIASPVDCDGQPSSTPAPVFVTLEDGTQVTESLSTDHEYLLSTVVPGTVITVIGDTGTQDLNLLAGDSLALLSTAGMAKSVTKAGGTVTVSDRLLISGNWGVGPLGFAGGNALSGAPVYVDTSGQIRTVPEHTSILIQANASNGSPLSVPPGTTSPAHAGVTGTFNNPSAPRWLVGVMTGKWGYYVSMDAGGSGEVYYNIRAQMNINGALAFLDIPTELGRVGYALSSDVVTPFAISMPPGGSFSLTLYTFISSSSGTPMTIYTTNVSVVGMMATIT